MIKHFLYKDKITLFVFVVISLIQSSCMHYGEIGRNISGEIIGSNFSIPEMAFYEYLKEDGVAMNFLLSMLTTTGFFFVFQLPFNGIYLFQESRKDKIKFAIIFWLLPAILGLPTLIFFGVYLVSPFAALSVFLTLISLALGDQTSISREMITENWASPTAALGWYHLLWLGITIKHISSIMFKEFSSYIKKKYL